MKKTIPIPGEKKLLKAGVERLEEEKGRPLSEKEKRNVRRKIHKKLARMVKIGGLLSLLGISTVLAGTKLISAPKEETTNQQEISDKEKTPQQKFKEKYKSDVTISDVRKEINELQDKEDILHYLKNIYIEKYEEKTGDTTLKTNDIKIIYNTENYAYYDKNTGNIYTHGDYPKNTEQKLADNGIEYGVIDDTLKIYRVEDNDGKVIDCMSMQYKEGKDVPTKVIYSNQDTNNYESILSDDEYMAKALEEGLNYYEDYDNEQAKERFIEALEQLNMKENTVSKNIENIDSEEKEL